MQADGPCGRAEADASSDEPPRAHSGAGASHSLPLPPSSTGDPSGAQGSAGAGEEGGGEGKAEEGRQAGPRRPSPDLTENSDAEGTAGECARALRPGGVWFLRVFM